MGNFICYLFKLENSFIISKKNMQAEWNFILVSFSHIPFHVSLIWYNYLLFIVRN